MMPEYRFYVHGDDEGQMLASLHQWVLQDQDVNRWSRVTLEAGNAAPGEMGPVFDVVTVTLSNSIALGSLIMTYLSWRDSRPHQPTVSIERDGVVVSLTDTSPEKVSEIIEMFSDQVEP
jgi:hypothetical protein